MLRLLLMTERIYSMKRNLLLVRTSFFWWHHCFLCDYADVVLFVLFVLMLRRANLTPHLLLVLLSFITYILCHMDWLYLTHFTSLLLWHCSYYCSSPYSFSLLIYNLLFLFLSSSYSVLLYLISSCLFLFLLKLSYLNLLQNFLISVLICVPLFFSIIS